jgi:6-phosphogluconate dehydrogenase (decarboxylating)
MVGGDEEAYRYLEPVFRSPPTIRQYPIW